MTKNLKFRLNNTLRKSSGNNHSGGNNGTSGGGGGSGSGQRDAGDSDSDDFMVKVNKFQEDDSGVGFQNRKVIGDEADDDQDGHNQHGALVKKILESKEQLDYNERTKEVNQISLS